MTSLFTAVLAGQNGLAYALYITTVAIPTPRKVYVKSCYSSPISSFHELSKAVKAFKKKKSTPYKKERENEVG